MKCGSFFLLQNLDSGRVFHPAPAFTLNGAGRKTHLKSRFVGSHYFETPKPLRCCCLCLTVLCLLQAALGSLAVPHRCLSLILLYGDALGVDRTKHVLGDPRVPPWTCSGSDRGNGQGRGCGRRGSRAAVVVLVGCGGRRKIIIMAVACAEAVDVVVVIVVVGVGGGMCVRVRACHARANALRGNDIGTQLHQRHVRQYETGPGYGKMASRASITPDTAHPSKEWYGIIGWALR